MSPAPAGQLNGFPRREPALRASGLPRGSLNGSRRRSPPGHRSDYQV
ncbi:hypothetical protein LF41_2173 [Lysobacter dokdonensis DS-58]|uniref:Uncharacterized protein n=1 Tax=Lysobacter dokdonensis DS-58 TaxID=1300345 RepID=A0A0A2WII6_9GAMM|nr:hypothetical protein LF41_2173 [Lysobacter dokdonensis DS-58]